MKVLHVAQIRSRPVGIARQMLEEQTAANSLGLQWDSKLFVPSGCSINEICVESAAMPEQKNGFRKEFFSWLKDVSSKYDLILLRHSLYSLGEYSAIKNIAVPVYLVHHTLEVAELSSEGGVRGRVLAALEKMIGYFSLSACSGIVAVTPEIARYELSRIGRVKPVFIYPNGISYSSVVVADDLRGECPEFIFVASDFVPWHGLDLLIEQVAKSRESFAIHLVGRLTPEQIAEVSKDSRYHVHGICGRDQIEALVARSWVGLGSFALHRKGMFQACTLKVREYLSNGLPVFSGHSDVFPVDFPYYCKSTCRLDELIEFAWRMRSVSRRDVSCAARPLVDKAALIGQLYSALNHDSE